MRSLIIWQSHLQVRGPTNCFNRQKCPKAKVRTMFRVFTMYGPFRRKKCIPSSEISGGAFGLVSP